MAMVEGQKRGRPPALAPEEREARILDGLETTILESGVGGATMDAVAQAAGMSKRTLYNVFGSRDALFAALMRRTRSHYIRQLSPAERDLPLEARLLRLFGAPDDAAQVSRQSAAFHAMIAGAATDPELARTVLRESFVAGRSIVRDELERAAARGELAVDDIDLATRLLLDMAYEPPFERIADPDYRVPAPEEIQARIRLAVRTFVRGAGLSPQSR